MSKQFIWRLVAKGFLKKLLAVALWLVKQTKLDQ